MLLEFKAKNYKSFKNELVFSLTPAPKQKGLDYSILKEKIGNKIYKGLCSAVIYGPNASGKTNIIGAMDTFKSIVLRGNIRNAEENGNPNAASYRLELIPNYTGKYAEPVCFSIKFTSNGLLIEYSFSADLGTFLDSDYRRKILSEKLSINNNLIFSRDTGLQIHSLDPIEDFLVNEFEKNADSAKALAISNLNDEELFLMNGFKHLFSSYLVSQISDWLENKFIIIYQANAIRLMRKFSDTSKNSIYVEETINDAVSYFGIKSNTLGYIVKDDNKEAQLCSLLNIDDKNVALPAIFFESYGTIRFVNLFPLIAIALANGCTLVVDEFDASIHPMALMNIINIFHNDEININRAQLVFNTHNPIFLNGNLYRRDEIKFVDRDESTHLSNHYSLSDFGVGKSGTRKHQDYMKHYFVDRYGAIKNVDFTPIFKEIISQKDEV